MTTPRKALSGPKKLYRHVGSTPVTMKLTPKGVTLQQQTQERTGLSRGDLYEYLLRRFAAKIPDRLLEKVESGEIKIDRE